MSWTQSELTQLKRLVAKNTLLCTEIADRMGKPVVNVRYMVRKLGLNRPARHRIGEWNRKHAHLREKALRYFLTHTFEETRLYLGLTKSELKSLFTYAYRDQNLKHIRKDTRRRDAWTLDETLFLLRHAGIREREWIAKKLNRSCARNIKERMQKWNAATKHLNGMPLSWARLLWPQDPLERRIRTKAGPSGGDGIWRFQILPWAECLRLSRRYPTALEVKACIRGMLRFQKFIHQTDSSAWVTRRIKMAVRAR